MTDDDLFQATIPVFKHYNQQIEAIVSKVDTKGVSPLAHALTPDTFSAGEHLSIAQGYALRTVYPLLGRHTPELKPDRHDTTGLLQRCQALDDILNRITKEDFKGSNQLEIQHTAGMAELVQPATDFVSLYAIPNFFFHLTMGYATFRQAGVALGKGDFDGYHSYPSDFSFT